MFINKEILERWIDWFSVQSLGFSLAPMRLITHPIQWSKYFPFDKFNQGPSFRGQCDMYMCFSSYPKLLTKYETLVNTDTSVHKQFLTTKTSYCIQIFSIISLVYYRTVFVNQNFQWKDVLLWKAICFSV